MTRNRHRRLWANPRYEEIVRAQAAALKSDGCTGVIDFYVLGCYEHDIAYRTHCDPMGNPITKEEADRRFRWYMQMKSWLGVFSPISWDRWWAVHCFGQKAWDHE